jgi:uroporphyrinogen III methyltransferase/synthase
LVTRAAEQAKGFADSLRAQGASVLEAPMVEFAPPRSWQAADAAIAELETFDWIVFASANSVRFFLQRMECQQAAADRLNQVRVAVVGKATAEIVKAVGLRVDLQPHRYSAEGLVEEFERLGVTGERILLPRAEAGRELLPSRLTDLGAQVVAVPVYRTVAPWHLDPAKRPHIDLSSVDIITFSSPSTVRHFLELFSPEEIRTRHAAGMRIAVIGPTTRDAATAAGLPVDLMPPAATFEAMLQELLEFETERDPTAQQREVVG